MPSADVEIYTALTRAFGPLGMRWFVFGGQAAILYGSVRFSDPAKLLYLFLCIVANRYGTSYYSETRVQSDFQLDPSEIVLARAPIAILGQLHHIALET